MHIITPKFDIICVARETAVNLSDIKVLKQLGGTVEDTELVEGIVFPQRAANINGPKRIEKAKIGFIQFCISAPKTDMDHNVIVSDYAAMDRVLKEERAYILNIVKQIKKSGCNVLLVRVLLLFGIMKISERALFLLLLLIFRSKNPFCEMLFLTWPCTSWTKSKYWLLRM